MHIGLFILCIAGAGFFAASETALMSVSLSTWDKMRPGRPRVEAAYAIWTHDPNLMIATLLLGNTLAALGASVTASSLAGYVFPPHHVPAALALILTSAVAGGTILLFGEILPKLYARHAPDQVIRRSAPLLTPVTRFLEPVLSGLTGLSNGIKRLLSFVPSEPLITAEDLQQAVSAPNVEGLAPSARRMLSNIMTFDQAKVSEIMIPRSQIHAVRLEHNSERMFESIVRSGFSRVPVYFGTIDNVVGIVYAKDLLVQWRSSGLLVLEDLLRTPYRIAPDAPLSVLLHGFRQGQPMAVVTDSRGRTQGIVTIEDAVEAIVGDIADEFDQPR
jgi:putative hemolysin